ncbi:MAG: hypothetical protein B7X06_03020, partial [Verrucomicrobia bacterium 21-51-4]
EHYAAHPSKPFLPTECLARDTIGLGYLLAHNSSDLFMHIAAYKNSPELLYLLAANGYSVNACLGFEEGCSAWLSNDTPHLSLPKQLTPLHVAVYQGNIVAVVVLLGLGANPYVKDGYGLTAIDYIQWGDRLNGPKHAQYAYIQRLLQEYAGIF